MKQKNSLYALFVFFLAASYYFYDYFIQVTPSIISEELSHFFQISPAGFGLLGSTFFFSYALMQIPAGLLLDRFGTHIILSLFACITACGLLLFATTHSFALALLSRVLIGVGSSVAFIASLSLIAAWFDARYFSSLAGALQCIGSLGSIVGLFPLSLAIDHFGWRPVLFYMAAFTFILAACFILFIKEPKKTGKKDSKKKTPIKLSNYLKTILKTPSILGIFMTSCIIWMPAGAIGVLWGIPYLEKALDISSTQASFIISFFWIGNAFGSIFIGIISEFFKSKKRLIIVCFGVELIALLLWIQAPLLATLVIETLLFIIGVSSGMIALNFSQLKRLVPSSEFGGFCAMNNTTTLLGGALAQFIIGWFLSHYYQQHVTTLAYQHAFGFLPIAIGLAMIITLFLKEKAHPKGLYQSNDLSLANSQT